MSSTAHFGSTAQAAGLTNGDKRSRDLPLIALLGFIGHVAYQLSLSIAQTSVSAGAASVLIALVPVISAILAIPILGEEMSGRTWIGMALAFGGASAIAFDGHAGFRFEPLALFGIVASACSAGYLVFQKSLLARYSAIDLAAYGVWSGTLLMFVIAPQLPKALNAASVTSLLAVVYLGIVPTAIGYSLWNLALARAPASQISSLLYLQPLFTFFLAWLVFKEAPTVPEILGGLCAFVGVWVVNKRAH